ncbi:MAG TPA: type 1 glutamine amidotransferase [Actinomycetota bacterium]|nr:type 1 glutamine amidotransferase [Actinomycetota bacterium]
MKPVLLVRNDGYETFGVAPGALASAGCDVRTVNMTRREATLPPLEEVAAVVTFGGTANVDQTDRFPYLAAVRDYTGEAVERGVPYLGICLGSQLLARALGRPVVESPVKEVGFEPLRPTADATGDRLLSQYADGDMVFEWHEDTYELPDGARLLATGDRVAVQAYRVGDLAWGIQFHQELDATELAWWIDIADDELDLESTWGKDADRLRAESERHMAAHEERGRELFRRFADVAMEHGG